ncbi:hypothetical protein EMA8858_02418 [Emticicia aquatica]|uniref:Uncharacterized protein n=2 Tax=Emticicia aquatica TaxID=1681835 RepID=A0ABM9ARN2_9BACT|nr:hypothetical protein EMA8858_02418 [Emticicia aquatica]
MALVAGIFTFSTVLAAEPIDNKLEAEKTFKVGMYRIVNSMKVNVIIEKKEGKALEISLKNERNETIYTEFVSKKTNKLSKKFDLTGLADGKYHFDITNGKETITKEINLETHQPIPADYRTVEVK